MKGAEHILSVTTGFGDNRSESVRVHSNGFAGARVDTAFCRQRAGEREGPGRPAARGRGVGHRALRGRAAAARPRSAAEPPSARSPASGRRSPRPACCPWCSRTARPAGSWARSPRACPDRPCSRSAPSSRASSARPWAAPHLTLTDDPLIPKGFGSRLFDGEGIAAKATADLREGRPAPLLHRHLLREEAADGPHHRRLVEPGVRAWATAGRPSSSPRSRTASWSRASWAATRTAPPATSRSACRASASAAARSPSRWAR